MRNLVYQREYVTDTALNDAEYTWRGDRVRWIDVADVGVSSGGVIGYDSANGIYYTSEECDFADEAAQQESLNHRPIRIRISIRYGVSGCRKK